jgi:hypothetical protein
VANLKVQGYNPRDYHHRDTELKGVIDVINSDSRLCASDLESPQRRVEAPEGKISLLLADRALGALQSALFPHPSNKILKISRLCRTQ